MIGTDRDNRVPDWWRDASAFLAKIKSHPDLWVGHSDYKYLELRVDTRDGAFLLRDRNGKEIRPDHVLGAINDAAT